MIATHPAIRFGGRLTGLVCALVLSAPVCATNITMQTPLGLVHIELFDQAAPVTVANFLKYVTDGDYENTFIHRSDPGFVIQGGGFTFINDKAVAVPTDPAILNEPGLSNVRGTLAMAKTPGNPNSATSQWFFNLADNSSSLDTSEGGFTVFGKVTGNGMEVVDAIAALKVWNAGPPFNELPLINFSNTGPIAFENLVMTDITIDNNFLINAGLNDAWFDPATPGQGFFINVFPGSSQVFLAWFTYDTERPGETVTANLGDPGHRWLTAFGDYLGNKAELDIEMTQGGVFNAAIPAPTQTLDGTIILEFSDCETGTVSYDIPSINRQGVIPIQRIALDNVARCEQLASQ